MKHAPGSKSLHLSVNILDDKHDKAPKYLVDCCTCTSLRHCQQTTSALCQSTSLDSTTSPAQYFWSSGLLCRRSDGLEFTTGIVSVTRRSAVIVSDNCKDELISALPLSTHSAVEMLHDSALYKFMIDIDIDILRIAL